MKLIGDKWINYSTKSVDNNNSNIHDNNCELEVPETASLGQLIENINWMMDYAKLNNMDPYNMPVFIANKNEYESRYCFQNFSMYTNGEITIGYWEDDKLKYITPDIRPKDGGEFWASRGVGYPDVSGFIKSKSAGERLQRIVNLILENDHPKTHLDYREYEPNWIQFKFHQDEFDVEKLDKMARDNNDIITMDIIKECKK